MKAGPKISCQNLEERGKRSREKGKSEGRPWNETHTVIQSRMETKVH